MIAREDRREDNVDFENQALVFNNDLKKVGVVVRELKRQVRKCGFRCWLSKEEKE